MANEIFLFVGMCAGIQPIHDHSMFKTCVIYVLMITDVVMMVCYTMVKIVIGWPMHCTITCAIHVVDMVIRWCKRIFSLYRIIAPLIGIVAMTQFSFECSKQESFRVKVGRCEASEPCMFIVLTTLNCSAIW